MPNLSATDGVQLYYEESGRGTPIVFIHEYAGDYRTWEPQMRHFSRSNRCITFSQRGYGPYCGRSGGAFDEAIGRQVVPSILAR